MKATSKLLIVLALALGTFSQHSAVSAGGKFRFKTIVPMAPSSALTVV